MHMQMFDRLTRVSSVLHSNGARCSSHCLLEAGDYKLQCGEERADARCGKVGEAGDVG